MGLRFQIAKAVSGALTWGLRTVARRPAGSLPGKVALGIDPAIVSELSGKLREGSVVVVGTNGKTTVTNLLANVVEQSGASVLCNRTGANLKRGIASALLQGKESDWGVIECDELWLAHVLPDLRPTWVLLLNLFRDQLDRCGEIDRIQESIIGALVASPQTGLVFNADDPLCAYIAKRARDERAKADSPLRTVAFGVGESMNLAQNVVSDATMCQVCSHMFTYEYRQYGQLGAYRCPECGFERPELDFVAKGIELSPTGVAFDVARRKEAASAQGEASSSAGNTQQAAYDHVFHMQADLAGTYNVYNLLAIYACATMLGCSGEDVQSAARAFDPKNGRLQNYVIDGRQTLLNLAKNPTGFNQNLRIVASDCGPHAVAFFINDQVVDGHDISWIWDIDFEELVAQQNVVVFAGGARKNDLQVRLKYAGIAARLIDDVEDAFEMLRALEQKGEFPQGTPFYAIANYSALPPVHKKLDSMAAGMAAGAQQQALADEGLSHTESAGAQASTPRSLSPDDEEESAEEPVVIAHVLPDLLNLYGDGGNVRILEQRLRWRGIPVKVRRLSYGMPLKFDDVDLVFLGGGPDREQKLAAEQLAYARDDLARYIEDGGPVLAICGGYQILGRTWLLGDEEVAGLGLLGIETRRPGTSADRIIGNIALNSPLAKAPVIGFENHAGRTYLDEGVTPFGTVVSRTGRGNNDEPGAVAADGVIQGSIVGTYLHGTLLAKNPEVADWLLARALARHGVRTGGCPRELTPLNDTEELAANALMAKRLM